MDELLTKARLLEGVERREQVYIPALNGRMEIRPLTSAQWAEARVIAGAGIPLATDRRGELEVKVTAGDVHKADHESDLYIARMGLVEGWTDEELDRLPAGAVEQISRLVQELSGVGKVSADRRQAEMSTFRDEQSGNVPAPAAGPSADNEPI